MRPLVGVTCSSSGPNETGESKRYTLPHDYIHALARAGGDAVILPATCDDGESAVRLAGTLGGILLSGGADLDPRHFGEDPHPCVGHIDPERDAFELALVRAAIQAGTPILAICRGIQVLNVAMGGTLYQDIASQVNGAIKHKQDAPRYHASHKVVVERHSKLAGMVGAGEVSVNSFHHQAVREVAPGFFVSARATDGVIEGIESAHDLFVVGVQWHPECMTCAHPAMLEIFEAFVAEAAARR
ncbi:MAG: gamma-glutamyl-gamma-aminobutyrate hydrolase family protein [Bacillota bacterium]|nr:gamma-glutamyl-gamma-aminobutyrate hydrolase family protein [Bacillota bacterium]